MRTKTLLLPHAWQVGGWIAFGFWLLLFVVFRLLICLDVPFTWPQSVQWIVLTVAGLMPYMALVSICLSQERVEDEYVHHIRSVSIFCVAVFVLLLGMLSLGFERLTGYWGFAGVRDAIVWLRDYFTQAPVMVVLYIVVFKGLLWTNWMRSRRYEQ
ncbi:MAG: hypothetical protein MSD82_10745 [Prevotella sp.]|nr:hypothetical protein [Prevotella sp.]